MAAVSLKIAKNLYVIQVGAEAKAAVRWRAFMKSLRDLLRDHEQRLRELTSPAYEGATTPEVRAILVKTCRDAIEQLKRDIEEEASALD